MQKCSFHINCLRFLPQAALASVGANLIACENLMRARGEHVLSKKSILQESEGVVVEHDTRFTAIPELVMGDAESERIEVILIASYLRFKNI